jgi:hypothetical protein
MSSAINSSVHLRVIFHHPKSFGKLLTANQRQPPGKHLGHW